MSANSLEVPNRPDNGYSASLPEVLGKDVVFRQVLNGTPGRLINRSGIYVFSYEHEMKLVNGVCL